MWLKSATPPRLESSWKKASSSSIGDMPSKAATASSLERRKSCRRMPLSEGRVSARLSDDAPTRPNFPKPVLERVPTKPRDDMALERSRLSPSDMLSTLRVDASRFLSWSTTMERVLHTARAAIGQSPLNHVFAPTSIVPPPERCSYSPSTLSIDSRTNTTHGSSYTVPRALRVMDGSILSLHVTSDGPAAIWPLSVHNDGCRPLVADRLIHKRTNSSPNLPLSFLPLALST
mmetsp:Transcript_40785/g.121733  ORF Transcript_40785/g.121733 Transcript_40785/m.121733 type:complete len:232 (+) Transcript_40785:4217-4912(+)